MTREELIEFMKATCGRGGWHFVTESGKELNGTDIEGAVIKALEQEPILDKIRAEIQNGTHHFLDGEPIIEIKEVLQIIDKYKAESEGKE